MNSQLRVVSVSALGLHTKLVPIVDPKPSRRVSNPKPNRCSIMVSWTVLRGFGILPTVGAQHTVNNPDAHHYTY